MTARHRKTGISLVSLVFGALAACTSYTEIPIETPIRPKLDVAVLIHQGRERAVSLSRQLGGKGGIHTRDSVRRPGRLRSS